MPFLILSLAGLGLNLLTGYAGQISLGAGAFMMVGAYATFAFQLRLPQVPLPLALIARAPSRARLGWYSARPPAGSRGFT